MTTARLATLVIDCADSSSMAQMYRALGAADDPRYPGQDVLLLDGLPLCFRELPAYRPPTWPHAGVPVQLHLDLFVDSPEQAAEDLVRAGATVPDFQPHRADGLLVLLDPAGHPFCLGTPVGGTRTRRAQGGAVRADG